MSENMEVLLKAEDKPEVDRIAAFVRSLDEEKQDKLKFFIEGVNFATNLCTQKKGRGC